MFGNLIEAALLFLGIVFQDAGTHHRRKREGHHRGDNDRDRQGDGEFTEEPTDDIPHEEQGDEHGDQRNGEGHNREANLLRALQRRLHWRKAFFKVAGDVLDHDDGIIHDEAGGDGEGHQGEVVEAVAEGVHGGEGADDRQRHGDAGNDGGIQVA